MLHHLIQDVRRHRSHMSTQLRRFHNVYRMADACDQDLSVNIVVSIDLKNLIDYLHPFMACVVQATDEGTNIVSTSLRPSNAWFGEKTRVRFVLMPSL